MSFIEIKFHFILVAVGLFTFLNGFGQGFTVSGSKLLDANAGDTPCIKVFIFFDFVVLQISITYLIVTSLP